MKRFIVLSILILAFLMMFTSCKSIGEEFKTINKIVEQDMNPTETTAQR